MFDMRLQSTTLLLIVLTLPAVAQNAATAPKEAPKTNAAPATVDRAYLQSIWDGWAAADLEKQSRFYAQGPGHLFFDVAPLKYSSWQEYRDGVAPSLKDAPKVTYALNDDVQIHPAGPITWVAATLTMSGQSPQGEKETLYLRWTAVLEQQDGRWLITHEHVSAPAEPPPQQ
jgi:ketosteroid isomerase-like protein